jgi:hypothetical protein
MPNLDNNGSVLVGTVVWCGNLGSFYTGELANISIRVGAPRRQLCSSSSSGYTASPYLQSSGCKRCCWVLFAIETRPSMLWCSRLFRMQQQLSIMQSQFVVESIYQRRSIYAHHRQLQLLHQQKRLQLQFHLLLLPLYQRHHQPTNSALLLFYLQIHKHYQQLVGLVLLPTKPDETRAIWFR